MVVKQTKRRVTLNSNPGPGSLRQNNVMLSFVLATLAMPPVPNFIVLCLSLGQYRWPAEPRRTAWITADLSTAPCSGGGHNTSGADTCPLETDGCHRSLSNLDNCIFKIDEAHTVEKLKITDFRFNSGARFVIL